MKVEVRFTGDLWRTMVQDLVRPHSHAEERVGFGVGRTATYPDGNSGVLLTGYRPIPDAHYEVDPEVGARLGPEALTWAMQEAYRGRETRTGLFHVHRHDHKGETWLSRTDALEIPKLIPGFQSVSPQAPHGFLVLSRDHASAWVWVPGNPSPVACHRVSVIDFPLRVFERRRP